MSRRISLLHPATIIATSFWVGKMPFTPGTWGSLPAFPIAFLIFFNYGSTGYVILPALTVFLYIIGAFATKIYMDKTRKHDPKEVVIDEVVGQLITIFMAAPILAAMPDHGGAAGYSVLFACFVLFRLFDIIKPWPIGWVDKNVKGATGVMFDDVLAGLAAGLALHLGIYILKLFNVYTISLGWAQL